MRIARNFSSFCFELFLEIAEDAFLIPPRIRFRYLIRNPHLSPVSEYGGVAGQLVHRDDFDLCEVLNESALWLNNHVSRDVSFVICCTMSIQLVPAE